MVTELTELLGDKELARKRGSWLAVIQSLATSQGFYGRLWKSIRAMGVGSPEVQDWLSQFDNCKDDVDFILALEG